MADRLTSPVDNNREEATKETPKTLQVQLDSVPQDYVNPLDDTDPKKINPVDGYPHIFCDIDFELKQKPNMFAGFDKMNPKFKSESKSEVAQLWQYKRWKTWRYLLDLPKITGLIQRGESEAEGTRGTVSINAVTYYITKGMYVDVPTDVRTIIEDSQSQTSAAGRQSLVVSLAKKLDPVTGLPKNSERLER